MPEKSIAIISSQALSLINFRGSLIRCLADRGLKVYAMAPDFDSGMRAQVEFLGAIPVDIDFQRTGMNPWHDLRSTSRLARKLKDLRPDMVLAYFIKPVIYGMVASWLAGVPLRVAMIEGLGYVFTTHPAGQSRLRSWKKWTLRFVVSRMYRFALTRAHAVVFLNQDDIAHFIKDRLVDREKVELLGGIGVDLEEWAPAATVVHPVTFLLAARLLREKGIVEYADAARRVKAIHPQARFILLGALDTNPGALARSTVEQWVHEGLLEWPGHVQVQPWLAQASVFVLPSYREGVPRSTQEAMAMARAVITTDAPGCRETVVQGRNGYMVPVRDVDALAAAMLQFLDQPQRIATMGLQSRRIAEQKFDVRDVNARMQRILGLP